MPEITRRGFLQLFGVGAATAAVATSVAAPLFVPPSVSAPEIIVPTTDLAAHYIFERVHGKFSVFRDSQYFVLGDGVESGFHIPLTIPEGMDPHAVFYQAAIKARSKFAEVVGEASAPRGFRRNIRSPQLSPWGRPVTFMTNPICTIPSMTRDSGMDLFAEFEVHWVADHDLERLKKDHKAVSESGQYPIEIPSDLQMAMLMRLDREIIADPRKADPDFLRRWRPGKVALT